jgi:hypothetical protein
MAWTNITNAQLAIGAPVRSIDLLALRDNIVSQANGDSGAPQQQTAGIANNAVTAPKISFVANGLQNSGGSLAIACPAWGAVGSYATGGKGGGTPESPPSELNVGSDYSAAFVGIIGAGGTWRCMGYTGSTYGIYSIEGNTQGLFTSTNIYLMCRVA